MDLNGDGNIDILSGSYSRMDQEMAGLFQVLWGMPQGKFGAPTPLNNIDGEPLIIPQADGGMVDNICTRPTAVDLNGDGHLDIVSGNFGGTFHVFYGKGSAKFPASGEWLKVDGKLMKVAHHSDPFFVDWDGDGDQDMLSGSADGGAVLFTNIGTQKEAKFAASVSLIKPAKARSEELVFGMEHIKGAQGSTRVWAADMNDDGKLDLVLGDSTTLTFPADGLSAADARKGYAQWLKEQEEMAQGFQDASADQEELGTKWQAHYEKMKQYVTQEMTGFVWVYYQK